MTFFEKSSLLPPVVNTTVSFPIATVTSRLCLIEAAKEAVEYGITIPLVPKIEMPPIIPSLGLSVFIARSFPFGTEIITRVSLTDKPNQIEIDGGEGVGRVTKPGLGLEINSAAINPTPKKMIIENIREIGKEILEKNGVNVIVSVPRGKELATKTDNPRLGIIGGISILGTSGIVIPYSTASFAASIRQSLDVTVAMGNDTVVLTTGGRSEDFSREIIKLPDHCFVQMGDFSGYTVQQCAKRPIKKAYVAGFIGKLTKMAMGVKQTHVKGSKVDMQFLSELAQKCNAKNETIVEIKKANTARHVYEIVIKENITGFFDTVCSEVYNQLRKHSEAKFELDVIMFDFDGKILGRYPR